MSKRSRKQGRPSEQRDPATHLPEMKRRQRIMTAAARRWDETRDDDEVVVMVTQLRTLLSDDDGLVNKVRSIKRSVLFFDSAVYIPGYGPGWMGVGGLTSIAMSDADTYIAPICHSMPDPDPRFIRFDRWWRKATPVLIDGRSYTREFVVYEASNTDGVHVSEFLDSSYLQLKRPLANVTVTNSGSPQREIAGVAGAAIRQIAWEVERTLVSAFALKNDVTGNQ